MALNLRFIYRRRRIILPALLILLSLSMLVSGRGRLNSLFSPFLKPFSFLDRRVRGLKEWMATIRKLRKDNERLREEKLKLEAELSRLKAAIADKTMAELLAHREGSPFDELIAEVVGMDPTNWYETVLIDKGSRDGIEPGMAVCTHLGLVGRVVRTNPTTSQVMLISDRGSSVSALIEETRDRGIVEGLMGSRLRMRYLPISSKIEPGFTVRSSGLGSTYPKDLLIGKVEKVWKGAQGLFQEAEVEPSVDLSKLERVLIVKEF